MFSKYSVKKPFTVLVAVILVIVLGTVSVTRMTPDLLPEMSFPYIVLFTTYIGAAPEEVEQTVTKPLEQNLAALDDLSEINALRNKNAKYLEDLIADLDYITVQKVPEGAERLYAYHYVRYNPEALKGLNLNTLLKAIAAEGASCGSCGYGRLHLAPLYTGDGIWGGRQLIYPEGYEKGKALPITEDLAGRAFMLAPRFEKECDEHIQQYAEAYHKVLENVDELVEYEIKNNLRSVKIDNDGRSINIYK